MTVKLQTALLAIGIAVVAGIAIGVMFSADPAVPVESSSAPVIDQPAATSVTLEGAPGTDRIETEIADIKRDMQHEIEARRALEQKLDSVSRQLAALDSRSWNSAPAEETTQSGNDTKRDWFDEHALLDNGVDAGLTRELKAYYEQFEMERLYLRDRAAREGWDREKTRSELGAIESREQELRERLGESAYDAYLYASGQPNRVAVTSVLASAQAGQAGIQSGDHIVRYDNQRIYNWRDLRSATTSGDISDVVEVEVERDGQTMRFYLARGPMGIRMDSLSVAP